MATNSGTWARVRGVINSQTETETGLDLEMEHVYATADGAVVWTRDKAVFTTVPGKDQTYMVEIAYTVVEAEGSLTGYSGAFYSFGLIKASEGKAVIRYTGEICKWRPHLNRRIAMPFVRISHVAAKSEDYVSALSDGVHRALIEAFGIPEDDFFQILTEQKKGPLWRHSR